MKKKRHFVPVGNTNRDKRVRQPRWCYQPGQKVLFCPGCQTRDKRAPPFVPDWRSRLRNRDNRGFPTETNKRFCSSACSCMSFPIKILKILYLRISVTPYLLYLRPMAFGDRTLWGCWDLVFEKKSIPFARIKGTKCYKKTRLVL